MILLSSGKETEAASVMMADLMFRKNEYDQATNHFKQLLHDKPDNYASLERIVDLLRRAGKLQECQGYLDTAAKSSGRAELDAGYNYCKGLYLWYAGRPNEALKSFNKARKDSDYGNRTTYNMVEICLNPDNETIGGELYETERGSEAGDISAKVWGVLNNRIEFCFTIFNVKWLTSI